MSYWRKNISLEVFPTTLFVAEIRTLTQELHSKTLHLILFFSFEQVDSILFLEWRKYKSYKYFIFGNFKTYVFKNLELVSLVG